MHYTYVLESLSRPGQRYVGHTSDLKERLAEHNTGKCSHTSNQRPWKVKLYVAFETLEQSQEYSAAVLGLIFLRFARVNFTARRGKGEKAASFSCSA